jgi:hypothetical protein
MPARPTATEVAKAVMDILTADFEKVKIVDVKVLERDETDDEITLEIQVVFEGKPNDLDARKVAGAVRHVRPKLNELGETAFPIFSFISKGEAGDLVPA